MIETNVTAIPAFADNYIWLIRTTGKTCAIVDPGDAAPVLDFLAEHDLDLRYVLITHHHADHIGGLHELQSRFDAEVFGPEDSRIGSLDHVVREGDKVVLPDLELEYDVIEVPGHTRSHIAYYGHGQLFCGDTLFSVGCGRLFEGTAEQMQRSLDKLAVLPADTLVYCAHEYTLGNCRFAVEVEPRNDALLEKLQSVEAARAAGEVTIPSRLGEELQVNPFLRSRHENVIKAAKNRSPRASAGTSTLAVIRDWKDQW